jgi:hypothetical protein
MNQLLAENNFHAKLKRREKPQRKNVASSLRAFFFFGCAREAPARPA